jgi:hypothetical protein
MPPVDPTFGDYLRAIITADRDLVPNDPLGYRVAFIEAFRRRGIYPRNMKSLSEESLRWSRPRSSPFDAILDEWKEFRRRFNPEDLERYDPARKLPEMKDDGSHELSRYMLGILASYGTSYDRHTLFQVQRYAARLLNVQLKQVANKWTGAREDWNETLGILPFPLHANAPFDPKDPDCTFEVHSVRPTRRIGPNGELLPQLIIEILQSRRISEGGQEITKRGKAKAGDFLFKGGATLIINTDRMELDYNVVKRVSTPYRRQDQMDYMARRRAGNMGLYFDQWETGEPFALVHGDGGIG